LNFVRGASLLPNGKGIQVGALAWEEKGTIQGVRMDS